MKKYNVLLVKSMLIILTLIVIIMVLIKRFVYFRPSSTYLDTVGDYKVINHLHLYAWLLEGSNNKIILFCQDRIGNMSYCEDTVIELNNLGYSVLIFDYSGYGKSYGVPSEQQCYDDVSSIVSLLMRTYKTDEIVLYGTGIGSAISAYASMRYRIPTLILEYPIENISSVLKDTIPSSMLFLFNEFNTHSYIKNRTDRTLLIHDNTINTLQLQIHSTEIIIKEKEMPWNKIKEFIDNNKEVL